MCVCVTTACLSLNPHSALLASTTVTETRLLTSDMGKAPKKEEKPLHMLRVAVISARNVKEGNSQVRLPNMAPPS